MQRRQFITLVGGTAATWPLRVRAQQSDRLARIGYLRLAPASQSQREESAFRDGLADLGYVEARIFASITALRKETRVNLLLGCRN